MPVQQLFCPELLVLDLNMPRVSGFEVLSWLGKQPGLRERVPVLVVTSSCLQEDLERTLRLGAREFHVKPPSYIETVKLVQGLKKRWLSSPQPS